MTLRGVGSPSALEEGMRALLQLRQARLDEGDRPIGWKVGVNDSRGQAHLGLDNCVFGFMTSGGRVGEDQPLTIAEDMKISAEAEIGILFGADIAAGASMSEIRSAVAGITPAIEIVEPGRPFTDLRTVLGHNVWHVGVAARTDGAFRPDIDLRSISLAFRRNGEVEAEADIARVLPPIEEIVRHAADFLGRFGIGLRAGDLLISGACAPARPLESGDRIEADFAGLGSIAVRRDPAASVCLD